MSPAECALASAKKLLQTQLLRARKREDSTIHLDYHSGVGKPTP